MKPREFLNSPPDQARRTFLIGLGLTAVAVASGTAWPILKNYMHQQERREWIRSAFDTERQRFQELLKITASDPTPGETLLSPWKPTEQFAPPEIRPFAVPVFSSLPENTVCIYLPGAGENRPEQSMGEILQYYHRFLLSRGLAQEQAVLHIQKLAGKVKHLQSEPSDRKRLAGQLRIMAQYGLYCLPWELFPEEERTPLSMACAAGGLIQTLPEDTPVVLLGHSLGGFSLRVFYKMLQSGDLDSLIRRNRIIGGVSISEGYYGDILGSLLYLNRKALHRYIGADDRQTGIYVLQFIQHLKKEIIQNTQMAEQLVEKITKRDLTVTAQQQIYDAINGFLQTFKQEPETIGRIVRLTAESMVDPEYVAGVHAGALEAKGCMPVIIRSLNDIHALTAGIPGAQEIHVNHTASGRINDIRLQYCQSNLPDQIPRYLVPEAHSKYPQAASLVFGK